MDKGDEGGLNPVTFPLFRRAVRGQCLDVRGKTVVLVVNKMMSNS